MEISMGPFFDEKRQCRIKYAMGARQTFAPFSFCADLGITNIPSSYRQRGVFDR